MHVSNHPEQLHKYFLVCEIKVEIPKTRSYGAMRKYVKKEAKMN